MVVFVFIVCFFGLILGVKLNRRLQGKRRKAFIENYQFPAALQSKLIKAYPHLSESDADHVVGCLRDYFQMNRMAGKRMVSMPSQAVDVVWHEFILYTQEYQRFCRAAFGHFLHHSPAEIIGETAKSESGVKLAWRLACNWQVIRPDAPTRLPRIFAVDKTLKIEDGFHYSLDCKRGRNRNDHCATHIGCSSGSGVSCASGCSSGVDFGFESTGGDSSSGSSCSSSSCSSGCGGGGD